MHQKINTTVFQDPDAVMDNFVRVTSHQRRKLVEAGHARCLAPFVDGYPNAQ